MSAKDRMNKDDICRDVTKVKKGCVKCPWCGRWNDMTGIDWLVEYNGHGMYSMSCLVPCLSCEREMFADLEFADLKVKEE